MKTIICDDDVKSAELCKEMVSALSVKHGIDNSILVFESGKQFLFKENNLTGIDLVYMDEHMPGMTGMETARELRERGVSADIVFYTVDPGRAIEAYDVEALHYILKEKTPDAKFERIFLKAAERTERRHSEMMTLSCAGEHRNIDIRLIRYFEVVNRIVTVVYDTQTGGTDKFEFYSPLNRIEEILYGKGFLRIHRSYLVRKACIASASRFEVSLATGEVLPIGRTYRPIEL